MTLAKVLMFERQRRGLSLRQVEKLTGVSFNTVMRIEQGKPPSLESFVAIAEWLGIPRSMWGDMMPGGKS